MGQIKDRIRWHVEQATYNCKEAVFCLGLALKDSRRLSIWLRSTSLSVLLGLGWLALFVYGYKSIAELALIVAIILVFGLAMPLGMVTQLTLLPVANSTSVVFVPSLAGVANLFIQLFNLASIAVWLLALSAGVVLLFWIIAYLSSTLALARPFLTTHFIPVMRQRYPVVAILGDSQKQQARSWKYRLWIALCLCIPVVGGVLVIVWIGRRLVFIAATGTQSQQLAKQQRQILYAVAKGPANWMGAIVIVLSVIPLLNLAVPLLLVGGAGHLLHRALLAEKPVITVDKSIKRR